MNEHKEYQSDKVDLRVWRRLIAYAMRRPRRVAGLGATLLVVSAIDILYPQLTRFAIDHFVEGHTAQGLGWFALLYVACVAVQGAGVFFFVRGAGRLEMDICYDIRQDAFTRLQQLSFSFYDTTSVGWLMARMGSDVARLAEMIAWSLVDLCWSGFFVVGIVAVLLSMDFALGLLVLSVTPLLAVLCVFFQRRILRQQRLVRAANSRITGAFNEGIMGAKTSKTLVIEDKNTHEFAGITEEMRSASVRAAGLNAVYIPLVMLASSAATAIVLVRGGNLVLENAMLVGTLSAFTTYAVSIFEPIQQMARVLANIIAVQPNIERVMGLLDQKPNIVDSPEVIAKYGDTFHPKKENWEPIKGDIEFDDVSFQYPDGEEEVLSHFSLKIPAGTTVAIVGETGAGKSTLVNLACRFFEPTAGRILIDGKDYRERSQLWLHSRLGYVLQNPHLFSGTVMDNIRYGRLDATDEEVRAAAKAVSADTVVEHLEDGYNSDVGEGGDKLSTGEKQLISFARAVLADPAIFVLDEATSSIDTQTEQLIQSATLRLLKGRTSFLIAHRLSTIRQADLILVVKDGKIVEQGKHEELLQKGGYYHDLYSKQFQQEEMHSRLSGESA